MLPAARNTSRRFAMNAGKCHKAGVDYLSVFAAMLRYFVCVSSLGQDVRRQVLGASDKSQKNWSRQRTRLPISAPLGGVWYMISSLLDGCDTSAVKNQHIEEKFRYPANPMNTGECWHHIFRVVAGAPAVTVWCAVACMPPQSDSLFLVVQSRACRCGVVG